MKHRCLAVLSALLAGAGAAQAAAVPGPCDRFVGKLPNMTRALCESAKLADSGARSVQGTPLYLRDVVEDKAKLRVLVIGAIHGDELSAASLAFHWIQFAANERMQMPQPVHWRFVPVVNPDGLLARPPRRMNAHGWTSTATSPRRTGTGTRRRTGRSARAGTRAAGPGRRRCPSRRRASCTNRWTASSRT